METRQSPPARAPEARRHLSGFFEHPWDRPAAELGEAWKGFVLNEAGFGLRAQGRVEEARALFEKAEAMQAEDQPQYPLLYSLAGYRYCDLLLALTPGVSPNTVGKSPLGPPFDQRGEAPSHPSLPEREGGGAPPLKKGELEGDLAAVLKRAEKFFEWRVSSDSILTIALDHLTLGRTHLHLALAAKSPQPDPPHLAQATDHLDRAVDGLRESGNMDDVPRGLLARAALWRWTGQRDKATADLDEAFEIAERGGMRLHLTDVHLERARLRVHRGEIAEAREDVETARGLVAETGYRRRDSEVADLERILQEM